MDTKKVISVLAVAVVLILGIWYLQKDTTAPTPPAPQTQEPQANNPARVDNSELLKLPSASSSQTERSNYFIRVADASKVVNAIAIQERCTPDTLIVRANLGKKITFTNMDAIPHTITVDNDHSWLIEPGKSVVIPADFGHGVGTYAYSCESSNDPVGLVLITEPGAP